VMEYLEGETLAQRLHRGLLSISQVIQYAMSLAHDMSGRVSK